jgi:hypothetical protein
MGEIKKIQFSTSSKSSAFIVFSFKKTSSTAAVDGVLKSAGWRNFAAYGLRDEG